MVEICRRLDGIPLAIELAASRMASMTASEVRDRLDQRFRLLVGSRRGLERHHTLRHAVAWSYDHLDDEEKSLLERCSVFAGGFDLQSACAVGGFDGSDDYAVLDLLDALVRKSLLVADRSSGRTRFSMLETIRQFAEEQLVAGGEATEARTAHARYFAGRETDILALWDSPRQREAYTGSPPSWPICAPRSGGPPTTAILMSPPPSRRMRRCSASEVENYEPIAWAEELIEPARAVDHSPARGPVRVGVAVLLDRTDRGGVGYTDAGQSGDQQWPRRRSVRRRRLPWRLPYVAIGQPERWTSSGAAPNSHAVATPTHTPRTCLVIGLVVAGSGDEAMAAADGLIDAAEATGNPQVLSWALLAYGLLSATLIPTARLTPCAGAW